MQENNSERRVGMVYSLRSMLAVWFFAGMPLCIGLMGCHSGRCPSVKGDVASALQTEYATRRFIVTDEAESKLALEAV